MWSVRFETVKDTSARAVAASLLLSAFVVTGTTPVSASPPTTKVSFSEHGSHLLAFSCSSTQLCVGSNGDDVEVSRNGGGRWKLVSKSVGPTGGSRVESFDCPAVATCYAAGGVAPDAFVMTTTDLVHWRRHNLVEPMTSTMYPWSLHCLTSRICLVGGGEGQDNDPGVMLRTVDGGTSWTSVALPTNTAMVWGIQCPTSVDCVALAGLVPAHVPMGAGSDGFQIISTSDGGIHWSPRYRSVNFQPGDISCASISTCVVGVYPNMDQPALGVGPMLRSLDGGVSWRRVATTIGERPEIVSCVSEVRCVGERTSGEVQDIGESSDGGATWSWRPVPSPPGNGLPGPPQLQCQSASTCLLLMSAGSVGGTALFQIKVP